MAVTDKDPFLEKYRIDCPAPSSLAVRHAEPVSVIRKQGFTFSDDALDIIHQLVLSSGLSGGQFNQCLASSFSLHHRIIFFLDRGYHMAQHIWAIRNSLDEIAMTSYLGPKAQKNVYENPPPVGILYISDVKTHTELSQRSPFLGLLLPIADSPPDDEIWVYFLAKAQQVKIEESEGVEAPIAKSTQRLMIAGLIGDQS